MLKLFVVAVINDIQENAPRPAHFRYSVVMILWTAESPLPEREGKKHRSAHVDPEKGKYLRRTIIDYVNPYGTHEQRDGLGSDRLRHARSLSLSLPLPSSSFSSFEIRHPLKYAHECAGYRSEGTIFALCITSCKNATKRDNINFAKHSHTQRATIIRGKYRLVQSSYIYNHVY